MKQLQTLSLRRSDGGSFKLISLFLTEILYTFYQYQTTCIVSGSNC